MVGSLELIRRKPDDTERVRGLAEAGLQAAERGAKLTGQLLAFSRAQRLELQAAWSWPTWSADMRDLLRRTLGPLIAGSGFDLGERPAAVLSDRDPARAGGAEPRHQRPRRHAGRRRR